MFSDLTLSLDQPTNRLYQERDRRIKQNQPVIDLVSGQLQSQGVRFPDLLLQRAMALGQRKTRDYRPDPLGKPAARQAISRYYASQSFVLLPEHLFLTPGTSLSYLYAFKVLANPGDEILCPRPSYPLFDMIADVAGVRVTAYPLKPDNGRWRVDLEGLAAAVTPRTRAIVLISPHNPTGWVASREEIDAMAGLAREKDLALVSDEVFSPFVLSGAPLPRPRAGSFPLVFTLNGFSKMLALPGSKIGWIGLSGDPERIQQASKALEIISDTFLPVPEATQAAVPMILNSGRAFARRLQHEIGRRMQSASAEIERHSSLSCTRPEGGFYLAVRLESSGWDDEAFAFEALSREGILVHPGFFYELEGNYFVVSGVVRPAIFREALNRLAALAQRGPS